MMRTLAAVLPLAAALHPRPGYDGTPEGTASFARWLIHESDFGVVAHHHDGPAPFAGIVSTADGVGSEDSTGVIYTYIPSLDVTYQDLLKNPNVTITWSEMALANGTSGGCMDTTAENPPCGRVSVTGQLTPVPDDKLDEAKKILFATHPIMEEWDAAHMFKPFWVDPASITDFFVINMFGGAIKFTTEQYLAADWYRKDLPQDSVVCSTCGHIYDAEKDGGGVAFDDLPEDWTCPVCFAPKSAYHKITKDGHDMWVHHEEHVV
jgi:rubredoxin